MEDHDDLPSTNLIIFVACFTTCWARLRFCEALDHLQDLILYFDTDSVLFVEYPGNPPIHSPLGAFLGGLH